MATFIIACRYWPNFTPLFFDTHGSTFDALADREILSGLDNVCANEGLTEELLLGVAREKAESEARSQPDVGDAARSLDRTSADTTEHLKTQPFYQARMQEWNRQRNAQEREVIKKRIEPLMHIIFRTKAGLSKLGFYKTNSSVFDAAAFDFSSYPVLDLFDGDLALHVVRALNDKFEKEPQRPRFFMKKQTNLLSQQRKVWLEQARHRRLDAAMHRDTPPSDLVRFARAALQFEKLAQKAVGQMAATRDMKPSVLRRGRPTLTVEEKKYRRELCKKFRDSGEKKQTFCNSQSPKIQMKTLNAALQFVHSERQKKSARKMASRAI